MIATVGVVITALRPGGEKGFAELKPTIIGLVAAAGFALSAVGFRGAVIVVPDVSFVTAASYTLVFGLFVQTLVLTVYLLAPRARRAEGDPRAVETLDAGGLHGRVRLAILVPGARADGGGERAHAGAGRGAVRAGRCRIIRSSSRLSARELSGIVLIVVGVALLVAV